MIKQIEQKILSWALFIFINNTTVLLFIKIKINNVHDMFFFNLLYHLMINFLFQKDSNTKTTEQRTD